MKTDIQIAQEATMKPILDVANQLGMDEGDLELYGKYKAKISNEVLQKVQQNPNGKLILVTAINPTPAGEGKTTTTVGLGQAMSKLGKKAVICLREPSLGPIMGLKGGAAGGGYAQVVPMEDINLHFTGDMHAITTAHALLSAAIDNHIHHGNALQIDSRQITWKRAVDMNDRALRQIVVGLGGKLHGVPREDGFIITVASEIMAILCLAEDLMDLKDRISKIIFGYTFNGEPVTVKDLNVQGAMALVLKDAIKPNLVQTLENTPCLIHGGPFANIAHGCNSVIATKLGLKLADYVITEAGFGADLGAEKFFNIKCRKSNLHPDAVVLVATIRALKYNGGVSKEDLNIEDVQAVERGFSNLEKHIENIHKFGVPVVVTLNQFVTDSDSEIAYVKERVQEMGCSFAMSEVWGKGGEGGVELAEAVLESLETKESEFNVLYSDEISIQQKIQTICTEIYGAKDVKIDSKALKEIERIDSLGYRHLPVCMAKTQYSLSDNPTLLGRPTDFTITIREVKISAGAGFIVVLTGNVLTMPGLSKNPAAMNMDIDKDGKITGLF